MNFEERYTRTQKFRYSEPEVALNEARKTLEAIIEDLYMDFRRENPENAIFQRPFERLNSPLHDASAALKDVQVYPRIIFTSVQTIKNFGNIGSHNQGQDTSQITQKSIASCMSALDTLMEWYREERGEKKRLIMSKEFPPQKQGRQWIVIALLIVVAFLILYQNIASEQTTQRVGQKPNKVSEILQKQCQKFAIKSMQRLEGFKFQRKILLIPDSTSEAQEQEALQLDDLVRSISNTASTRIIIEGEIGVGKTTLKHHLNHQGCQVIPATFSVNINDFLPHFSKELDVTKLLGIELSSGIGPAQFLSQIERNPSVLVIDGLDTLPQMYYTDLPVFLRKIENSLPQMSFVLISRRNISLERDLKGYPWRKYYFPLLSKKESKELLRTKFPLRDGTTFDEFWRWVSQYNLNRVLSTTPDSYAFLSTFDDVEAVLNTFETQSAEQFKPYKASIYEDLFARSIINSDESITYSQTTILQWLDDIILQENQKQNNQMQGRILWKEKQCIDAGEKLKIVNADIICNRFLYSKTPVRFTEKKQLKLLSLELLLRARFQEKRLQKNSCAIITEIDPDYLILISDFLIGYPGGQQCLSEILSKICTIDANPNYAVDLIMRGWPIQSTSKVLSTVKTTSLCEKRALELLRKESMD